MNQPMLSICGVQRLGLGSEEENSSESMIEASALATGYLSHCVGPDPFWPWLSDDEKNRANRFLKAEDRRDFMAAHALLRMQLRERFPELPFPAPVTTSEDGAKPRLSLACSKNNEIDFNISHTRGMATCVIGKGYDVGIDCEPLNRQVDPALGDACFSKQECDWLRNQIHLRPSSGFLHLWTLKEAVTKALGIGMIADWKAFSILPFPPRLIEPGDVISHSLPWKLCQVSSKDGFLFAVAARQRRA